MIKTHTVPFFPTQDVNHSFVQCIRGVYATQPPVTLVTGYQINYQGIKCLCSSNPYLNDGPNTQE
jgi:hypothetical protein